MCFIDNTQEQSNHNNDGILKINLLLLSVK